MADQVTIRRALRSDVPAILEIIHGLAIYENAPHEVKATEESLHDTLSFADDPSDAKPGYARTLLAVVPDPNSSDNAAKVKEKVAGMALYFHNYSTWRAAPGIYLEDLFVWPEYRGKGYGKRLLTELAGEVRRVRGARLEWACLKWNKPSLDFYEAIGAKRMDDEWVGLRVDGEKLDKLAAGSTGIQGPTPP
ncbi:acyl-CoA N-acyltransferase [Xylona heveae TC161]|uniref:Acyl-CoA N-acyltransferase n=1 Tax=Xylona heveae (strain CBS 132557 / TC161) TaxID=1328760 RepID=A0A165HDQ2_XYLHT|nr:acyl-CoA N-acyltransferase [Xylona heveae TC161]KZF23352.1 acyl-CoA N-acyltransferase [Xylona heveae TC161]